MIRPVCFLILCFGGIAQATAPSLTELQPRGAQQGKTLTLTLIGRELLEGSKIITTLPAVLTPLTPTPKGFPWLVELRPDVPIGTYPIRIQNQSGLSNILFFTVGAFPEIAETEGMEVTNNSVATAEPIKALPITINGTLRGADRDFFRITARAGEHRVFEVEARRVGSAIDPVLELYDEKSNLLARNEDAPGIGVDSRIDYTFSREGSYFIAVHDARFSKQEQNFYRLKIGSYNYAEAVFPLGGRRGETVQFEFTGKTGVTKTSVKLPQTGNFTTVAMPGSPVLPVPIALGDIPELTEPVNGPLPVPGVVNGRLGKSAEVDKYTVRVVPGDMLLIELKSRELTTSRLDGLITIYGNENKKLASAGDTASSADVLSAQIVGRTQGDPFLNFKVPPDVHEVTIAVEDLAQRGGSDFGYRLSVQKQPEDFLLSATPAYLNAPRGGTALIAVAAERRGYDGPIRATILDLPKGWTAEGGYIAAETMDASGARAASRRGVLTVTVTPDAELPRSDLVVVADGGNIHRQASGAGALIDIAAGTGLPDAASTDRQKAFTAPWLNMAMPAAITKEPIATLAVRSTRRTRMAEGDAFDFEWAISTKEAGIVMPSSVSVDAPGARDLRVIDMKAASKGAPAGTFRITTTKSTAPATYDLIVTANFTVDGARETIVARAIPWVVTAGEAAGGAESESKITSGRN
jgi:hypothetical protein